MVERKFTWFPKLTRVIKALPAENVAEFSLAVMDYGTNGVEPVFSSPILTAVFEGVREDIDNSVNARCSNKGGRPKKNGGFESEKPTETPVSQNENPRSETETPVSDFSEEEEPPLEDVSQNENPSYIYQAKPSHTKPNQNREKRFEPPSVQDVRDYCAEKGYTFDAEQFVAFYESKGWKVGRNPMKSWQAACTTWHKRHQGEGGKHDFSAYD